MSLQKTLEAVQLQHVFWHRELCRAPEEQLNDCEFFRRQCEAEVALLEDELRAAATHPPRDQLPRKAPERRQSNAPPAKTMLGGHTNHTRITRPTRKIIRR